MIIIMIILIYLWTFNSLKLKCDGIMVNVYNIIMYVKHSKTACKTLKDMYDMIKIHVSPSPLKWYYYVSTILHRKAIFPIILNQYSIYMVIKKIQTLIV